MPVAYACRNCNLMFEVGPYHGFSLPVQFFSMFVCEACGYQYYVEETHYGNYGIFSKIKFLYHYAKSRYFELSSLLNQTKRRRLDRTYDLTRVRRLSANKLLELPTGYWHNKIDMWKLPRDEHKQPLHRDWYFFIERDNYKQTVLPISRFQDMRCIHCDADNITITDVPSKITEVNHCPRCKQTTIEAISAWRT